MHKFFAFLFSSREIYYHWNRKIVGRKELLITGRRLEEVFRPSPDADDDNDEVNPGTEGSYCDYRVIYKDNAAGCRARPEV